MKMLLFLTVLPLAACVPEPASEAPQATPGAASSPTVSAAPEPAAVPAPVTLEGYWRVAGIDGAGLDEPYGLALVADREEIWAEPRCAGLIRSYAIDGNAFSAVARAGGEPVCEIGMPPRMADVVRALDAATRIERTPSNGIAISGGGHSVTLYSQ